ncbi:alpha/beta fold hydrolase [Alloactinosynnema sp. L-07]|uniref:alpha/beta fold hydrolase n=1 Tax=Alloactinosynnema sp. L-07 TaxID=1653480 RepID=UPI00082F5666|nr:alpha/beta hydrolase [Alloactinosynnema sp. L-07]
MSASLSTVPVAGGHLTVAQWNPARRHPEPARPVLAIHGITASHRAWSAVAAAHPGRIIAPDLRGRGGSSELSGPFGMAAHAEDCVAVLDAHGIDEAVVVGHSMGGFVAAVLAHRYPERVAKLVLVDGGAPLPGVDDIETALGPAVKRLSMRFPDRESYRDFWRAHPAFAEWTADIESYVDYDLIGTEPELRSRVNADAVRTDFLDLHSGDVPRAAFAALKPDTLLIRATKGLFDEPSPLYPHTEDYPFTVRTVDGSNHYSILFGADGVRAVASALAS